MSEARKCDRCSSYFEYDENMPNYIVFGNRHIIVDLKRGKDFDICPKCMKEFEDWFWPSEEDKEDEPDKPTITDPECRGVCLGCKYGHTAYSVSDRTIIIECRHYHKRIVQSYDVPYEPITPEAFKTRGEDIILDCHGYSEEELV